MKGFPYIFFARLPQNAFGGVEPAHFMPLTIKMTKPKTSGISAAAHPNALANAVPAIGDDASKFKRLLHDYGMGLIGFLLAMTLAVVVYTSQKLSDVNTKLAEIGTRAEERVTSLVARVDRIANALPDVKIRVAREELSRPIPYAIIVSDPYKNSKSEIIKKIAVIDSNKNQAVTFIVPANATTFESVDYMIAGITRKLDPQALTFAQLDAYASEANENLILPAEISPKNSYVLYTANFAPGSKDFQATFTNGLHARNLSYVNLPARRIANYADVLARLEKKGDLHKTIEVPTSYKRIDLP